MWEAILELVATLAGVVVGGIVQNKAEERRQNAILERERNENLYDWMSEIYDY